jgi:protein O-GlcNAc transferase
MSQNNPPQVWNDAIAHFQAGRWDQAEALCRAILADQPKNSGAIELLGMIAVQTRRFELAVDAFTQTIALQPENFHPHFQLGVALVELGKLPQAVAAYQRAIALQPNVAEMYNNLANTFKNMGKGDEAITAFRRAIAFKPDFAVAHFNFALLLHERGQLDEAQTECTTAIKLQPQFAQAWFNLGNVLSDQSKLDEAIAAYQQAIALEPNNADALANMGNALRLQGKLDETIAAYRRAIAADPNHKLVYTNFGNALKDQGKLDEALAAFDRAMELNPDDSAVHSNRVYTLHFHPDFGPAELLPEHLEWDRRHALPLRWSIAPHDNDRSPDRRLRIGYVSPDFRIHPVGRFMLPIFPAHDHTQFDIIGYSDCTKHDDLTEELRAHSTAWHDTERLSHEELANLIRRDRIDILVDLTMHMDHNRLLVFARKPAPVQATYLAYCSTTGLATMDYRITDPYLDPPGMDDRFYVERSIHLPRSYWCYPPNLYAEPVQPPPALATGQVTFACMNNFCKVNNSVLSLWANLLLEVPNSRLILHANEGAHRDTVRNHFQSAGVDPARIEFLSMMWTLEYFRTYHRIDIALDPFPYAGGTTTCDALWMGVPVITFPGQTAVSRAGVSILTNIGRPQWIARTPQQYVQIAADLAGDLKALNDIRFQLRSEMSPLTDAVQFTRELESTYRTMWRQWCETRPSW